MKINTINSSSIEEVVSAFRSTPYHLAGKVSGDTGKRLTYRENGGFWCYPVSENDERLKKCDYMLHENNGIIIGVKTDGKADIMTYVSFIGCDEPTAEWAREIMYV